MAKEYPVQVEFEVTKDIINASTPGHARNNPLALALSEALETTYHVTMDEGGYHATAMPQDDRNPDRAAPDYAPEYALGVLPTAYLERFDNGERVRPHWFCATRLAPDSQPDNWDMPHVVHGAHDGFGNQ